MKKFLVVLALASMAFVGCTRTEKHIATGAAVGAVAGHIIGGDTDSCWSWTWSWSWSYCCRKK